LKHIGQSPQAKDAVAAMTGFADMLTSAVRSHTGLHYVPSFNDFSSNSADDAEAIELDGAPRDQLRVAASAPPPPHKTSNKTDDLPAPTIAGADIHKVNRPMLGPSAGRADWIIDNARGGSRAPSVWQFILQSQSKEKLPAFHDITSSRHEHATIGAEELKQHFKVTSDQAAAMLAEADRDNDSRISRQEFDDILNEVSA
ncbi:hypothetical protein TSOC_011323, partial [Tetrabaena socialis]